MSFFKSTTAAFVVGATALILTSGVSAQTAGRYVQLPGVPGATKAVLYVPDTGPAPHVAVLLIHRTSNFLAHIATQELPRRGFMVLGMNPRSDNNEAAVRFESNALDIKAGVNYLRSRPGITKVLLFGHSGGGPATTFYEAVAENGIAYCQGANKLTECDASLAGLPRVDGLVLADAHPGISTNELRSLNPAVRDETNFNDVDSRLDPFSEANGYNPSGASHYSDAFKRKYFHAQSARMNRLIAQAQFRLQQIQAGLADTTDDEPFIVPRGDNARLLQLDPSVHHSTLSPRKLLKNDGSIVEQIVESVRVAQPELKTLNSTFGSGTLFLTLRSFLSGNAVRSTDAMDAIDFCSSNNSTPCALQTISVPLLITTMGGHYFIRDNEFHYEVAQSADKDFIVIEGATHGLGRCTACETTPGQYSNVTKNLFDYVAAWINARY